jgi:hypothetical protein
MTKHTPGPWVADIRVGCFFVHEEGEERNCLDGVEDRGVVFQGGRGEQRGGVRWLTEEQQANARLIAAAPDMLAALKAVREHCPADPDINPAWETAWRQLEGAIAKAEVR